MLWLALHNRLSTVYKLSKWGIQVASECILCQSDTVESHSHLFFNCSYSRYLWQTLLTWMSINRQLTDWDSEVHWLSSLRSARATTMILGFILAAVVYHFWIERNSRGFTQVAKDSTVRVKEIVLQLHIVGQRHTKWRSILEKLNNFPC